MGPRMRELAEQSDEVHAGGGFTSKGRAACKRTFPRLMLFSALGVVLHCATVVPVVLLASGGNDGEARAWHAGATCAM